MSELCREGSTAEERYALPDLWRSLAVCAMVIYHAVWDLSAFDLCPTPPLWMARCIGGSFILVSGMVVRCSRSPLRRGFFLFCAGLLVSVITTLAGLPVQFGILQLLGVCMMLCGAFGEKARRRGNAGTVCLLLALFAAFLLLTDRIEVDIKYLYPLGLRTGDFYSADYYPLLPWGILFLLGGELGEILKDQMGKNTLPGWLTFPGRHSLLIYLLHQPILYGLCWLLYG